MKDSAAWVSAAARWTAVALTIIMAVAGWTWALSQRADSSRLQSIQASITQMETIMRQQESQQANFQATIAGLKEEADRNTSDVHGILAWIQSQK